MNNFTCPICDSFDVEIFIEIDQIPVYCNLLYKIREEALNAPRADMELRFCTKCGHVYNYAFNPDLMDYTQDYENSLHFSPRFQQYANELAHRLVEQYNLYYKDIIEIGCGDGDFLKLLCEIGNNRGVGFDPSHSAEIFSESSGSSIKFISDFYSERYLSHKADFICCRHMLEHVNNPKDFLICLRDTLKIKSKTVFYFEVPSVMFTIKELGIWDLIYEHCSYFNKHSFEHLFETCGFDVFECHDTYNGQFLSVEAVPSIGIVNKRGKINENLHILNNYVAAFHERYKHKLIEWQQKLKEIKRKNQRIILWGAGSKGVTFLNVLNIRDQIEYVVDINPNKQGKYIAGTGQKIVQPEFLVKYRPDIILVMNSIYLHEIQQVINEFNIDPEFITC